MAEQGDKEPVFLDTSVIIAALLSPRGGSFYILSNLHERYRFQINEYVLEELFVTTKNKFSTRVNMTSGLFSILGVTSMEILPNVQKQRLKILDGLISEKDAPILISALENSTHLITLDKEFLGEKIVRFAKSKGLIIMNPREFIAYARGG